MAVHDHLEVPHIYELNSVYQYLGCIWDAKRCTSSSWRLVLHTCKILMLILTLMTGRARWVPSRVQAAFPSTPPRPTTSKVPSHPGPSGQRKHGSRHAGGACKHAGHTRALAHTRDHSLPCRGHGPPTLRGVKPVRCHHEKGRGGRDEAPLPTNNGTCWHARKWVSRVATMYQARHVVYALFSLFGSLTLGIIRDAKHSRLRSLCYQATRSKRHGLIPKSRWRPGELSQTKRECDCLGPSGLLAGTHGRPAFMMSPNTVCWHRNIQLRPDVSVARVIETKRLSQACMV